MKKQDINAMTELILVHQQDIVPSSNISVYGLLFVCFFQIPLKDITEQVHLVSIFWLFWLDKWYTPIITAIQIDVTSPLVAITPACIHLKKYDFFLYYSMN